MRQKTLDAAGQEIAVIGQGTMGIGGYLTADHAHDEQGVKALELGIAMGMTFIDTAEVYGNGHSEELVARATKGKRKDVFIASKFSPEHSTCEAVIRAAEGSLRRLQTDYIDLYQVHWPNPSVPIEETMGAMERLVEQGRVRYIGACNFSLRQLKQAQQALTNAKIASIQVEYNLFDRSIEKTILPYCEKEGITTVAYSPLDQGKIGCGDSAQLTVLEAIAAKYQKKPSQIILRWLTMHPTVVAIPKAIHAKHVKENATACDFDLTREDFERIERVFTQEPAYIPADAIRVSTEGTNNRGVYQTLHDAMANPLHFVPSPAVLAQDIRDHAEEDIKPVRLIASRSKTATLKYDLMEGRIRYWAWVIAYNGKKPIPAYIRKVPLHTS